MKKIEINKPRLPNAGGSLKGMEQSLNTDKFRGALLFNLPFNVPKARGLEPSFSLNYSSAQGNGIFGMGFVGSLSEISLKTSLGQPKYNNSDIPLLDGNELVMKGVQTNGEWKPKKREADGFTIYEFYERNEGAFSLIEKWQNNNGTSFWKVTNRENITRFYGKTSKCQTTNPNDSSQIFTWHLQLEYDTLGNCVQFTYLTDAHSNNPKKYIKSIQYCNKDPFDISGFKWQDNPDNYHLEIVFDYGTYDYEEPKYVAYNNINKNLVERQDSFSSFSSGFEIRTTLLCSAVHVFNRFEEELSNEPVACHISCFKYDDNPVLSFLKEAKSVGLKFEKGAYALKALPPLSFSYSSIDPSEMGTLPSQYQSLLESDKVDSILSQAFKEIGLGIPQGTSIKSNQPDSSWTIEISSHSLMVELNNGFLKVYDSSRQLDFNTLKDVNGDELLGADSDGFQLVDLYGEGIAGILISKNETLLYQRPLGDGNYQTPMNLDLFPIEKNIEERHFSLRSLNGDGSLDLVVNQDERQGFYKNNYPSPWSGYQEFEESPTLLSSTSNTSADLTGDGLTDLFQLKSEGVDLYPSKGDEGYGNLLSNLKDTGLPPEIVKSPTIWVTMSDVFGDGREHLVRIMNGSVECWPNLGYGKFGNKRTLKNAPFISGGLFTDRLFLADVDGSGTTDLIYAHEDRVSVFFNESGNGFSKEKIIPLPSPYSQIDNIQFADVLGNGTQSLVFTSYEANRRPKVYYYPICGKGKPHLLTTINNSLGNSTQISYCSSVDYYLKDLSEGRTWLTKLPIPVQVVDNVKSYDFISRSVESEKYAYHDGYFDPVERQFTGFGFVEYWDSSSFEEQSRTLKQTWDIQDEEIHFQSPSYTKSWHLVGAYKNYDQIIKEYRNQYFSKDGQFYFLPGNSFDYQNFAKSDEDLRQAHKNLEGVLLHEEIYDQSDLECPHQISESNVTMKMLQPTVMENRFASFFRHGLEEINYIYEKNTDDPSIAHKFDLEVDDFGNLITSCSIHYKRRTVPKGFEREQGINRLVLNQKSFENETKSFYRLGIPLQEKQLELNNLQAEDHGYFESEELKKQIAKALKKILRYDQKPGQALSARLISWDKIYYWDEDLEKTINSNVPGQALVAKVCHAMSPVATIDSIFSDDKKVNPSELGYHREPSEDIYWWRSSPTIYFKKDLFYRAYQSKDPLGNIDSIQYDDYSLLVKSYSNALGYEIKLKNDYQFLTHIQTTDFNGISTEVLLDPLGMVVASSIHANQNGKPIGDAPLSQMNYQEASFESITSDPNKYLQGATSVFFYDPESWLKTNQPVGCLKLLRETHVSDLQESESPPPIETEEVEQKPLDKPEKKSLFEKVIAFIKGILSAIRSFVLRLFKKTHTTQKKTSADDMADEPELLFSEDDTSEIQIMLSYFDGKQRTLEQRTLCKVDNTEKEWKVSGKKIYNNKGLEVEVFEPFYSQGFQFGEDAEKSGLAYLKEYDAFGRLIKTNTPKGFFSKTSFEPWQSVHYDLNDTVKDSDYYKKNNGKLDPPDQDALDKAVADYGTPGYSYIDNLGREFLTEQTLLVNGKKTGVYHYSQLDILGYLEAEQDGRNYGTSSYNFQYVRDMQGNLFQTIGADNGTQYSLENVMGLIVHVWDSRNFAHTISYDQVLRKTEVQITGKDKQGLSLDNTVEKYFYGDLNDQENFGAGKVKAVYDQAGLRQYQSYDIQGNLVSSSEQLLIDYTKDPDWSGVNHIRDESDKLNSEVHICNQKFNVWNDLKTKSCSVQLNQKATEIGTLNHKASYDLAGRLQSISFSRNDEADQEYVESIEYNPNDQHTVIQYGNGVTSQLSYEPETLRLTELSTKKKNKNQLQHIKYTYDPVGNITWVQDDSIDTIFNSNQKIEPITKYTYDSIYRLSKVSGRMQTNLYQKGSSLPDFAKCINPIPNPNDPGNSIKNYERSFKYDLSGNLSQVKQSVTNPFTLAYTVDKKTDRLNATKVGSETNNYQYDRNGNLLNQSNLSTINWNYRNNIANVTLVERDQNSDIEYYTYDATGLRRRKIAKKWQGNSWLYFEKTYFGDYEIRRVYSGSISSDNLKSEFVSVVVEGDQLKKAALYQFWTKGKNSGQAAQTRYQLDNNIGSICMEVDAQAKILTYQEYYPYGQTSISAGISQAEVTSKEYRFSGKEFDSNTGLYYFGFRYYNAYLRRWLCPDPGGTVDGLNLYEYVGSNPISKMDNLGLNGTDVTVHGQKRQKPIRHAAMNTRYFNLGQRIFLEMKKGKGKKPYLISKDLQWVTSFKISRKMGLHNTPTVRKAIAAGLIGDKKAFARLWRSAHPDMDEHLSTASVFHLLRGIGHSNTLKGSHLKQVEEMFEMVSHLRIATRRTGHKTSKGSAQHPTGLGKEFFDRRGKNHGLWDRFRREDALTTGESSTSFGLDRVQEMAVAATSHTLNFGLAPATANNVFTLPSITAPMETEQTEEREDFKDITVHLGGTQKPGTQQMTDDWDPNTGRPMSPRRQ